ncbi:carbohydrate ABC transporter permease [Arthrobacter dokdonensis]|uniref:carbohydrate ABC transporter permease n=1 Tax=Arthrobacter dokdonellae TaxID=2211210 RepID=UPI001D1318EA|nr:sugar ABC transporter permease [Arthrobacter dokdonellae]
MVGLLLVVAIPFVTNIILSFTKWAGIGSPSFIGFDNYIRLLRDGNFWVSFLNSIAMIVSMALVPTAISLLLAALLSDFIGSKFGPRIASFFRAGFYLPQILPVTVVGILWGWILLPSSGVLNSVLDGAGLGALKSNWLGQPSTALAAVMAVMVWFQVGYCLVMFMAGLARTDPSLTEAASLDGATWPQRFFHVIIPQLKPEIYVVLLTTSITALKVFAPIFVLTKGGPGNATTVPSYFAWQNFFSKNQVGYGSTISTVMTILIIILAMIFLKVQSKGQEH